MKAHAMKGKPKGKSSERYNSTNITFIDVDDDISNPPSQSISSGPVKSKKGTGKGRNAKQFHECTENDPPQIIANNLKLFPYNKSFSKTYINCMIIWLNSEIDENTKARDLTSIIVRLLSIYGDIKSSKQYFKTLITEYSNILLHAFEYQDPIEDNNSLISKIQARYNDVLTKPKSKKGFIQKLDLFTTILKGSKSVELQGYCMKIRSMLLNQIAVEAEHQLNPAPSKINSIIYEDIQDGDTSDIIAKKLITILKTRIFDINFGQHMDTLLNDQSTPFETKAIYLADIIIAMLSNQRTKTHWTQYITKMIDLSQDLLLSSFQLDETKGDPRSGKIMRNLIELTSNELHPTKSGPSYSMKIWYDILRYYRKFDQYTDTLKAELDNLKNRSRNSNQASNLEQAVEAPVMDSERNNYQHNSSQPAYNTEVIPLPSPQISRMLGITNIPQDFADSANTTAFDALNTIPDYASQFNLYLNMSAVYNAPSHVDQVIRYDNRDLSERFK